MKDSKNPLLCVESTDPVVLLRESSQSCTDGKTATCCAKSSRKKCCFQRLTRKQCLISTCSCLILIVVTIILIIFIFGKTLARSELNNTKIKFTKLDITPKKNYSFLASFDLEISHVSPMDGVMSAMSVNLSYNGSLFGKLEMPAMSVKALRVNKRHIDPQQLEVVNVEVWDQFSYGMLHSHIIEWELAALATVTTSLLGVHFSFTEIPFKKSVQLTSFNGLEDVQLSIFDLTQSDINALTLSITACIRNPSEIKIEDMGTLFFAVEYQGAHMGNVTANNASIMKMLKDPSDEVCLKYGKRGWNSIQMTGELLPSDRYIANEMMSRCLSNMETNLTAVSLSPATSIELLNYAMEGLQLDTVLNIDFKLIAGLRFNEVLIKPITTLRLSMTMAVDVKMTNPLGSNSPLNITEVDMRVSLRYKNSLIGTAVTGPTMIPIPNVVNGNSTITINSTAVMNLEDQGVELAKFAKELINAHTITLALDGSSETQAYSWALGWTVDVEAIPVHLTINFPGMNGLQNVRILDYSFSGNVPDGTDGCNTLCGIYMTLKASVINPSPFGLIIGEMNAEVRNTGGVVLGTIGTKDFTLYGNIENVMTMSGKLAPEDLTAAGEFMSHYMAGIKQETLIVGLNAGNSLVSWLQIITKGMELEADFPGADDSYEALTNVTIKEMTMMVSEDGTITLSGTITAILNLPKQVSPSVIIDVDYSGMLFDMIDIESNIALGRITVGSSPVQYNSDTQMITITFAATKIEVLNVEWVEELFNDLFSTPEKIVRLSGLASPRIFTNIGVLQLTGIPFTGETVMHGYNSFLNEATGESLMHAESLDISAGTDGVLDLLINITVTNPSNIAAWLGKIILQVYSESGYYLADVNVADFSLSANTERNAVTRFVNVPAEFYMPTNNNEAEAAARLFLSNYVSGVDQIAEFRGFSESSSISILKPALSVFKSSSTVPGSSAHLIPSAIMDFPKLWSLFKLPATLQVYNPFSANLTITSAHNDIRPCKTFSEDHSYCREYSPIILGYYTPDKFTAVIPSKKKMYLDSHAVQLSSILSQTVINTLLNSAGRGSFIKVNGTMNITVGGFKTQVDFKEQGIIICLRYWLHRCASFMRFL